MSWFKVNGIETKKVAALARPPTGARRDIGRQVEAVDGTTVVTRQARKHDLKFETVPLSGSDALAWEGLFSGEGNVWSFDSSVYSSKGVGGGGAGSSLQTTYKKYGAKALKLAGGGGSTWVSSGLQAPTANYTIALWAAHASALTFHHYAMTFDGSTEIKWIDGVLSPGFDFDDLAVAPLGELVLSTGTFGDEDCYFDDVVFCPYLWPADWAAQVAAAGAPFGASPFLTCSGDLVREAATRTMIGRPGVSDKIAKLGLGSGGLTSDVRTLAFDLAER